MMPNALSETPRDWAVTDGRSSTTSHRGQTSNCTSTPPTRDGATCGDRCSSARTYPCTFHLPPSTFPLAHVGHRRRPQARRHPTLPRTLRRTAHRPPQERHQERRHHPRPDLPAPSGVLPLARHQDLCLEVPPDHPRGRPHHRHQRADEARHHRVRRSGRAPHHHHLPELLPPIRSAKDTKGSGTFVSCPIHPERGEHRGA